MKNKNKTAIVTGATGDIGISICEMLVQLNYNLAIVGRDDTKLEKLKKSLKMINKSAVINKYIIDFRKTAMANNLVKNILADYDEIDVLVNNAGVGVFNSICETNLEELEMAMNVNYFTAVIFTKACIEDWLNFNKKGKIIINVSSIAGVKSFKKGIAYCTSKAAIESFTQVLWEEVKESEIKVSLIRPGLVNSRFLDNHKKYTDILNAIDPNDVANCVRFIVEQSAYVNVSEIVIRPIKKGTHNLFHEMIGNI